MGTVTGRFSSSNPNLQQVPARDPELGPLIRSLFIPEENQDW
jgi:DNA polymerase I-like protein with 3'-5' exonuclease and polymerase domains